MKDEDLERAAARLNARRHYQATRGPMTVRERLSAAWGALVECRYAMEGAARGWRC